MKYKVKITSKFKRDYKLILKRNYDVRLLEEVIKVLANGEKLSQKYNDHPLIGNHTGLRECHITPDWLLIYEVDKNALFLYLTRNGKCFLYKYITVSKTVTLQKGLTLCLNC